MRNKSWDFCDWPVLYSRDDYEEAREEVRKKMELLPEVTAVFEAGKVAYPGISDIDFLVIFKKEAESFYVPYEPAYSDRVRYMMRHKVFLLSEEFYKDYLHLNPLLRFVYGGDDKQRVVLAKKDLIFNKLNLTENEQKVLDVWFASVEILLGRLRAIRLELGNKMPIRQELIGLKGVEYMLNVINLYNLDSNGLVRGGDEFIRRLDGLNRDWFNLNKEVALKELVDLHNQGLEFNFKIAFVFNNFFKGVANKESKKELGIREGILSKIYGIDRRYKNVYFQNFGAAYLFSEAVKTPIEALELTLKLFSEHKLNLFYREKVLILPLVALPFELATIFLTLTKGKGLLSRAMRRDIYANSEELPILNSEAIKKRINLINGLTEVYSKKKVEASDGKGYLFGGNNVYQYEFGKEKWRRKLAAAYLKIKYWLKIREFFKNRK